VIPGEKAYPLYGRVRKVYGGTSLISSLFWILRSLEALSGAAWFLMEDVHCRFRRLFIPPERLLWVCGGADSKLQAFRQHQLGLDVSTFSRYPESVHYRFNR
jgi:hypothetical protein